MESFIGVPMGYYRNQILGEVWIALREEPRTTQGKPVERLVIHVSFDSGIRFRQIDGSIWIFRRT